MAARLVVLVGVLACSCGGSSSGGPGGGGGGDAPTVLTTSATCTVSQTKPSFKVGHVVATGTASGAAGSSLRFSITNGGQSSVTIACGGWTAYGTTANNVGCTAVEGTASTTWTVTQEVYWCLVDCDARVVFNNSDLALKYTVASIVDAQNANQKTSEVQVTCP